MKINHYEPAGNDTFVFTFISNQELVLKTLNLFHFKGLGIGVT